MNYYLFLLTKIPMVDDTAPDTLQCTTCLLPMQYQTIKDDKFLWQCFKCEKKYFIFKNVDNYVIEETRSPPK